MGKNPAKRRRRPNDWEPAAAIKYRVDLINQAIDRGDLDQAEWLFYCAARNAGPGMPKVLKAVGLRIMRLRMSRYFATGWELLHNVTPSEFAPDTARKNAYIRFLQRCAAVVYAAKSATLAKVKIRGMAHLVRRTTDSPKFSRKTAERWMDREDFIRDVRAYAADPQALQLKDPGWGDPNGTPWTRAEFWQKEPVINSGWTFAPLQ